MLHMHSKQYLHLLYTTLQASKKVANDPEAEHTVWTHSLGYVTEGGWTSVANRSTSREHAD